MQPRWSRSRQLARDLVGGALRRSIRCALGATLALACGAAGARGLIPAGLYEIFVTQELPNVAPAEAKKSEVCLTKRMIESAAAFHVRSENPIQACPMSDIRLNDDELIFRIKCPQPNTPSAKAKFLNTHTGFQGTINLDMGGKNMRLVERHRARRIGDCPNDDSASVMRIHEDLLPDSDRAFGRNPR